MFFGRCIYRLPEEELDSYWEDMWAEKDFDRLVLTQPKKDWWPTLEELLTRLAPGEMVLEAGCGAGPVVYLLHERGISVKGVDSASETIDRVKALHPDLDMEAQDVKRLDMPDGSVGLYISLGVVEHDPLGPDDILHEAKRVTKEDGLLLLTVPYSNIYRRMREPWWRLKHWLGGLIPDRWRNGPRRKFYQYTFSQWGIRRVLARHGFQVQRVQLCHTPVALKKDHGKHILFKCLCHKGGRVNSGRVNRLARMLNFISPRLMSHCMAVTAQRRGGQELSTQT